MFWFTLFAAEALVKAAIERTKCVVIYDPSYFRIKYPNGDVPADRGVCTDVIIRAYRTGLGVDLQKKVHEDMKKNFNLYPKIWGLKNTDPNIDHRRVPNLEVFFKRFGKVLKVSLNADQYKPGDIVTWNIGSDKKTIPHIGLVTNQKSENGMPLIVHNIGNGPEIEDVLFKYKIRGHYRYAV